MNNQRLVVIFLSVIGWTFHTMAVTFPCNALVSVPVADILYNTTRPNSKITYPRFSKDICHKTQVLYGERLIALKEKNNWLYVQILDQAGFHDQKPWKSCEGWIKKTQTVFVDAFPLCNIVVKKAWAPVFKPAQNPSTVLFSVSIGTMLQAEQSNLHHGYLTVHLAHDHTGLMRKSDIYAFQQRQKHNTESVEKLRVEVVKRAREFLGGPYCFGGRSAYNPGLKKQLTSVDCSGLIHLAYRAIGIPIPRCAHAQYLKTHPVVGPLQPGDLIFYAPVKLPNRMTHVMMYIGDGKLIEAMGAGEGPKKVKIVSVMKKIGKPLQQIKHGDIIGPKIYYFGSVFKQTNLIIEPTEEDIQKFCDQTQSSSDMKIQEIADQTSDQTLDIKTSEDEQETSESKTPKTVRQKIMASAKKFLKDPYRKKHEYNAFVKKKRQKVDCSELIQRSYRANGQMIPRSSLLQFRACKKIKKNILKNLKPADLIFAAARKTPHKINHVMMYLGNDKLIESTGSNGKVRIISLSRRIGTSIKSLKYGHKNRNSIYYAGTLLV